MQKLSNGLYRISNSITGQTLDVKPEDLSKYGLQAPDSGGAAPDLKTTIANAAPTVSSIIGQILGGSAGATVGGVTGAIAGGGPEDVPADAAGIAIGEKVGQTGGAALGQSFGEWVKNSLLGKKTTAGDLAKNAVEGGIYANIPGGSAAKSFLGKLGIRALGGEAVGAGTEAVQEFDPSKKNMGLDAGEIAQKGSEGAAANIIIPGAIDTASGLIKFAGEKIPQDIYQAVVEKPQQVAQSLYREVQAKLVGHNNVEYAIKNGIIGKTDALTSDTINSALDKVNERSKTVEDNLQSILTKKDAKVPAGDVLPGLTQIAKDNGLQMFGKAGKTYTDKVAPVLAQVRNILFGELSKGAKALENKSGAPLTKAEEAGSTIRGEENAADKLVLKGGKKGANGVTVGGKLVKVPGKGIEAGAESSNARPYSGSTTDASGVIQGTDSISLSAVNKAKRLLANYYNDNPVYAQMYNYLKDYIETKSGAGEDISALNQEAHTLSMMKQQLNKWKNLEGSLPSNLTPESINDAINQARQGKSKQLQNLLGWVTLVGEMGGYMGGQFMGYLFGKGVTSTTEKMMQTPEGQLKIAKLLQNLGVMSKRTYNMGNSQVNMRDILTQLGLRGIGSSQ